MDNALIETDQDALDRLAEIFGGWGTTAVAAQSIYRCYRERLIETETPLETFKRTTEHILDILLPRTTKKD